MKRAIISILGCILSLSATPSNATVINGSFESGFSGWTTTGDDYLVTQTGSSRTRHDYLTYQGWEGADVWFSSAPENGSTFAVFGSQGNESDGSVTSSLWTATQQYVSFWQAGNTTASAPGTQAFAEILDASGNILGKLLTPSYNDSVWRQYTFDLSALGLNGGDQFKFYYQDGASWSVLDNVAESGPALDIPEPASIALVGVGAVLIAAQRRRRARQNEIGVL